MIVFRRIVQYASQIQPFIMVYSFIGWRSRDQNFENSIPLLHKFPISVVGFD